MSFLIGFLAGFFGGMVGLGGGVIMIPLMVGLLKVDQHRAHGTSLVALVFTGLSGAIAYGVKGSVDITAAVLVAATAIATARAGAHFAHALPGWKLKRAFGGFLVFAALLMLGKPYLPQTAAIADGWMRIALFLAIGIVAGFISGMMGVGGGSIMVPAMVLLGGFGQHIAQGSSLLAMVPTGASGALTHWKLGNVRKNLLLGLIPGILIGTYLGGTLAHVFSDAVLRLVFSAMLILIGVRYLMTQGPEAL
jgi:uncharacterized membrane protein YfcA